MSIDEFFNTWNGKYCQAPGGLGNQCVDLANEYCVQVLNVPEIHANAIDWFAERTGFTQVTNAPDNAPVEGDLIIWGSSVGQYGHIAICRDANPTSFNSFDQNWPVNSPCHFQAHDYSGVLGWLHPNPVTLPVSSNVGSPAIAPDVPISGDQVKIDFGSSVGIMELQAARSTMLDRLTKITELQSQVQTLTQKTQEQWTTIGDQEVEITKLQEQINNLSVSLENSPKSPSNPSSSITTPSSSFATFLKSIFSIFG